MNLTRERSNHLYIPSKIIVIIIHFCSCPCQKKYKKSIWTYRERIGNEFLTCWILDKRPKRGDSKSMATFTTIKLDGQNLIKNVEINVILI